MTFQCEFFNIFSFLFQSWKNIPSTINDSRSIRDKTDCTCFNLPNFDQNIIA